jgi:hypothetical protein
MTPEVKVEEPKPIEFKATYHPDGRLHVECPLLVNPIMMKGFMEMIKEGVNDILENGVSKEEPKIQPAKGGIINFARGL